MSVLAVGTGHKRPKRVNIPSLKNWSAISWARPMINLLTEANEMASVFWAKQLGLGYFDFYNPVVLEREWNMDDASVVEEASSRADKYIYDFEEVFNKWLSA